VTLESAEADSPRGWSVSRNERVPLPAEFDLTTVRREIWNAEPASAFAEWKTRNSIDFAMYVSAVGGVGVPDPDADPFRATLVLFDAQAREVRPDAFSTMSPARALELLDEPSAPDIAKVAAFTVNNLPQPQTHLFRRRSGEFGLLQIQEQNARTGVVRFRYKLATAPPDKEAGAN
jgi:hypothetical protein